MIQNRTQQKQTSPVPPTIQNQQTSTTVTLLFATHRASVKVLITYTTTWDTDMFQNQQKIKELWHQRTRTQ